MTICISNNLFYWISFLIIIVLCLCLIFRTFMLIGIITLYVYMMDNNDTTRTINNMTSSKPYYPYVTIATEIVTTAKKFYMKQFLTKCLFIPYITFYMYYLNYKSISLLLGYLAYIYGIEYVINWYLQYKKHDYHLEYEQKLNELAIKYNISL